MSSKLKQTLAMTLLVLLACSCGANRSKKSSSSGGGGGGGDDGTAPTSFTLYIGIQGSNNTSRIASLTYNVETGDLTDFNEVSLSTLIGGAWANDTLRSLALLNDGTLIAGNNSTAWAHLTSALALASPASITMDAGNQLNDIHGLCTLPNGHVIGGEYDGEIIEYDASGNFVAIVNSNPTYSLSDCSATTNTRLFWVDYDGGTDANADIVLADYSGGWSETARYDTNTELSTLADSDFYSIVAHSENGYVYAFPQTLDGSRNQKILRCSQSGTLNDCSLVGSDLQTVDGTMNYIQAARQLPKRDEILFVSSANLKLYILDVSDHSVTEVGDLATLGLANIDTWGIRNMAIQAQ